MKKLVIIIIALFIGFNIQAQEDNSKKKLTRKEKKELKAKKEAERIKEVSAMVEHRQFVFEADQITNSVGVSVPINSNINFVMLDSNKVVFQTGSALAAGYNGVGGITLEGKVISYKIDKNERSKSYYIVMGVTTISGQYEIRMDIFAGGSANVRVMSMSGAKIYYTGTIHSFENSTIYQGTTY